MPRRQISVVLDTQLADFLDERVAHMGGDRSETVRNLLRRGLELPPLEHSAGYIEGKMRGLREVKKAIGTID